MHMICNSDVDCFQFLKEIFILKSVFTLHYIVKYDVLFGYFQKVKDHVDLENAEL